MVCSLMGNKLYLRVSTQLSPVRANQADRLRSPADLSVHLQLYNVCYAQCSVFQILLCHIVLDSIRSNSFILSSLFELF